MICFQKLKKWNELRKRSLNSPLHKFLVLVGVIRSPTFELMDAWNDRDWQEALKND